MRRSFLIGVVVGVALAAIADMAVALFYHPQPKQSATMLAFQLRYQRPRVQDQPPFKGVADPFAESPTEGLVQLAHQCGLTKYKLRTRDLPPAQTVFVDFDPLLVSAETFNCLQDNVRPPYLMLLMFQRCRWAVDLDTSASRCVEPQE